MGGLHQSGIFSSCHITDYKILIHQFSGELQAGSNVFFFQRWKLFQNIFSGFACTQKFKNGLNRNSFSSDGWFSIEEFFVNRNSIHYIFHDLKFIFKHNLFITRCNSHQVFSNQQQPPDVYFRCCQKIQV